MRKSTNIVVEITSKLIVEEAKFHDIQERKVELQQAIIKMEQGGSADGNLQGDRREKKKEETRTHNAQLHATISVVAVASVVAAIAAAMAASYTPSKDERMAKIDMAIASAATFVAMQCVEAAEAMGDERDHLASVVSSAVNVSSHDDTTTLTATAATTTALRGAATLKSRALKEVRNIAAVTLLRKAEEGLKFVAKLLQIVKYQQQYQRKGNRTSITNAAANDVLHICTDLPAWLGRHLLDDGEKRKYFGLKTNARGIVEIEYIWTQGVSGFFPLLHKDKIDLETDPCILQNYLITIN
ncbi:VAN3-binding protein-like [Arachis ipaensis]|uniref:VAN3-binding protein-like n=1 Tax=Arachis ipaensis TaxID=130454 RepID=UPI000A2AFB29|nr:VAN3-binding protein-like [Arachis ipaensis]XP_025640436.1 VAN3-binding protein-like [Arachis hypogaea]